MRFRYVRVNFIIHPCDPTVVICYLIWPCDTTICITYLLSHSYSLTYNLRIFPFGCIINTKLRLPSCDDIFHRTSLGFPSWCPESTRPTDSCFPTPAVKTSWCTADYINTLRWFCICITYEYFLPWQNRTCHPRMVQYIQICQIIFYQITLLDHCWH